MSWLWSVFFALQQENLPVIKYYTLKDPDPEPSLAWFVLNAFFYVGIVLLVAIGIGLALGWFRFWLLEKYPKNRFNGTPEDDLTETFRLD